MYDSGTMWIRKKYNVLVPHTQKALCHHEDIGPKLRVDISQTNDIVFAMRLDCNPTLDMFRERPMK